MLKTRKLITLGVSLLAVCTSLCFSSCGKKASPAETTMSETALPERSSEAAVLPDAESSGAAAQEPLYSTEAAVPEESGTVWAGYTDEDFLNSVRAGLEDRWASVKGQDGASMDTEAFREYASSAVQKELDAIGDLYYYKFEDEALAGLASVYVAALQDQLIGISESENQEALQNSEVYMNGYCLRVVALHNLTETYGLTVDPSYEENLQSSLKRYDAARAYLGME